MNKTIEKITLGTQSVVYMDNWRMLYEDPEGKYPMNCDFHPEDRWPTQMFLTKDNKISCLVCEREYANAKKKGLI